MAEIENFLYGDLHVKIINKQSMGDKGIFYQYLAKDGQTYYVEKKSVNVIISLGDHTAGFAAIYRNINDSAGELSLRIPVAHYLSNVEFKVGFPLKGGLKYSGKATVDSKSIGVDEVFHTKLEREYSRGLSKYFERWSREPEPDIQIILEVWFTPCIDKYSLYKNCINLDEYELKESYFPLRHGGKVTLYQDAHCMSDLAEIPLENDSIFKRGTCWEDICEAILDACHVVYIMGWDISHKVMLARELKALGTLGELLKHKSREGVEVLVLVWNGHVGIGPITMAKETKSYFKKKQGELPHNVKCVLARRNQGGKGSYVRQKITNLIFSHHQKCVIVDVNNKITAFIGGLDLCSGHYDTPEHRLYPNQDSVFKGDFFNPTFKSRRITNYPRKPWHDLHCKIEGPAAYDVLLNFKQRWKEATKKVIEDHAFIFGYPLFGVLPEDDSESWNVQIFRSIDSGSIKEFSTTYDPIKKGLICEENVVVERSIQMAYIKAIRSAQHFIYIENQFFIGSLPNENKGGVNLIPLELALKIASNIKASERFSVYVVIPMWPKGNPNSDFSTKYILYLQWQTIQMMYRIIAQAIKSAKLENIAHPTDYLNFYCLGNRQIPPKDTVNEESLPSHKYGRFMINVHSKGMIVDDTYVILGSANINHRSMDGSKDTEIAMGAYQPHYTCTKEKQHPHGQVYGYRMSLWKEHLGEIDAIWEKPETLDCVTHVNHVAESNWKKFTDNKQFTPLQGHILKYPVEVHGDGEVKPKPGHEIFPDVGGQVLGRNTYSDVLFKIFS